MIFGKKKPAEVFTPRSPEVNSEMYIHRADHERRLKMGLASGKALVIYGDSGCGKSWLYKKLFEKEKMHYAVLDLTDCLESKNIDSAFRFHMLRNQEWQEVGSETTTKGGISPTGVGVSVQKKTTLKKVDGTDYRTFLNWLKVSAGRRKMCVVFENLEHVGHEEKLMKQLQSLVMKADDPNFSEYDSTICLVGVESSFHYLGVSERKSATISNRLYEVPEVMRMTEDEALELIHRGFVEQLGYQVHEAAACCRLILFLSDRVPQYLQDLCLHIAYWAEENDGQILVDLIQEAALDWIGSFVKQSSAGVEGILLPNKTHSDRTAQVVYALSRCEQSRFDASHIEGIVRREFPKSTAGKRISVASILNRLSGDSSCLLRKSPRTGEFSLVDVKGKLVLRSCLYKYEDDETVELIAIGRDEVHTEHELQRFSLE